jgi:hypothetical protein
MNTTEMLAQLRLNCLLEDNATDYTDAVLLRELSDALTTKFQDTIVGFRNGTWQQIYFQTITSGTPRYRFAPMVSVLGKVEIGNGTLATADSTDFARLKKVDEGHADLFEGSFSGLGQPQAYVLRGNDLVLLPTPDNSGYLLRITYYRKPPRLMPSQNNVSGTDRGRVVAVNASTNTITVNTLAFDMSLAVPAAQALTDRLDVITSRGWFDHSMANVVPASRAIGGTTDIVFSTSGPSVRDVQVGDYVRNFGQSDWPMLPEDFHRCVVDVASTKILIQRGYQQKASNYAGDVTADLSRFETLYSNRTREEPRIIRAPLLTLRRWRTR